jgi:tRNA threonylcarbamoyladenosine biosynthesis protein TsaB
MRILGIDTATTIASVALVENGELLAEEIYPRPNAISPSASHPKKNHAEIVIPLIESVLAQACVVLNDIGGVAVSIGPGSFTGVRIGLSTVKGLMYGWNLPVVGISTLQAYASGITCSEDLICALLDARKKEVYMAIFRRFGAKVERLTEDLVMPVALAIENIAEHAQNRSCLLIGEGAQVYASEFQSVYGRDVRVDLEQRQRSVAAAVAYLGWQRIARSEADDLAGLLPVYVRPSEAESKHKQL